MPDCVLCTCSRQENATVSPHVRRTWEGYFSPALYSNTVSPEQATVSMQYHHPVVLMIRRLYSTSFKFNQSCQDNKKVTVRPSMLSKALLQVKICYEEFFFPTPPFCCWLSSLSQHVFKTTSHGCVAVVECHGLCCANRIGLDPISVV